MYKRAFTHSVRENAPSLAVNLVQLEALMLKYIKLHLFFLGNKTTFKFHAHVKGKKCFKQDYTFGGDEQYYTTFDSSDLLESQEYCFESYT